jgi:hypothetical protein
MADIAFGNDVYASGLGRTRWGAVWAGLFAFVTIWSVFGLLGEAIFASAASPNAAQPVTGMSAGMGIWAIVLTIIAMWVGGKVTGRLAGVDNRTDALMYGMIMFGLTVISTVVVLVLAGTAMNGGNGITGSTHSSYMLTVFADLGWWGFVSLFLGWLAVLGGAASEVKAAVRTEAPRNLRDIRPAA